MIYLVTFFMIAFLAPLFFDSWRTILASIGLQAIVLTLIAIQELDRTAPASIFVLVDLAVVRGILVPLYLIHVVKKSGAPERLDVIPANFLYWMLVLALVGAGAAFAARVFPGDLPRAVRVTAAVAEILVGFLILAKQTQPVGQAIGVLTIENGVILFEMLCQFHLPFPVQFGVATVFVLLIVVFGSFLGRLPSAIAEPLAEDGDVL